MALIKITNASELSPGEMKTFSAQGTELLLANVGGSFFAISNKCPHAGGDLSKGVLEGETVTCPRHGSRFDLKTGKALSGPKIGFLKLKTSDAKPYPVKVDGESVLVELL